MTLNVRCRILGTRFEQTATVHVICDMPPKQVPYFHTLDRAIRLNLARNLEIMHVTSDTVLWQKGDVSNALYVSFGAILATDANNTKKRPFVYRVPSRAVTAASEASYGTVAHQLREGVTKIFHKSTVIFRSQYGCIVNLVLTFGE